MSITELPVSSANFGPADFERLPPQDITAEQSVLGGMMMSKDAIADVVENLRGVDFYKPAHQLVYDAILDLYGRGEPADAVTVSAELTKRGEISRAGGAPYLATLIHSVPTAANAGYYAKIVAERAVLRRLVEAGTRITQMGYSADGEVDDIVDSAQAEIYAVSERRASEDYQPLSAIMEGTLDEIESIGNSGGGITGVPTGFVRMDELTNGLQGGQMVIVAARPAVGKALALDTPLPTPTGWTTMGEVVPGDELLGADGRATKVVAATDVLHGRPCFEVVFSDGTSIVADAAHLWLTEQREIARGRRRGGVGVRTTAELAATARTRIGGRPNHAVANARSLQLDPVHCTVPPYVQGVRLGVRHVASNLAAAPTLAARVPVGVGAARLALPAMPPVPELSIGTGRIPRELLRASVTQRRALLAGLLDADGAVMPNGAVHFRTRHAGLATDVHELVVSLGHTATLTQRVSRTDSNPAPEYVVALRAQGEVFRHKHKAALHRRLARVGTRPAQRTIVEVRPVASVPVRCVQVEAADHLYLAGRAMIPTHNSTLALDFARAASIKHGRTAVIFSLEMGRNEITMRLLSAEARVSLQHIRSGQLTDDDWTRLARRMGEVSSAPLYIDDSANLTMMEIRAKARRLKQRHDLQLIIVDYLQLMQSGKKVESRQQEVSEFSRALKLLAKELQVPVVALSQLNRGPEQRTDKKPLISDLRESGCLTAATRIMRADTNEEVALGELLAADTREIPVWSLDDRLKLVPRTMTHVFPSGVKEVFRLRLTSGREIEATANHPFLTYDGWKPLGELTAGSRVGALRHVPPPLNITPWDPDEVVLLAHLIGDGSFVRRQPMRYASIDEANLSAVTDAAARRFGITGIRDEYPAARVTTLRLPAPYRLTHGKRNPIAAWLDGLGLFGLRSHEKFVPAGVFGLPKEQVGLFLRHIWATDGSVRWDERAHQARIYYASTSRRLVDDLARLLLRFNVFTRVKAVRKSGYRDCYHLYIYGVENQLRFCDEVGVHGARGLKVLEVQAALAAICGNTNLDTVPSEVWGRVRSALVDKQMTHRQFATAMGTQFCGSTMWKHAPSRERLAKVATILDDADLEVLATNDVYWDTVESIESLGEQAVYDATVLGTHNFVADGISVHNSLEQDADIVILLHREDMHDRESPRAGEADLIVAKHRNGPCATVTVAFQGHYSRFVDMAPG